MLLFTGDVNQQSTNVETPMSKLYYLLKENQHIKDAKNAFFIYAYLSFEYQERYTPQQNKP